MAFIPTNILIPEALLCQARRPAGSHSYLAFVFRLRPLPSLHLNKPAAETSPCGARAQVAVPPQCLPQPVLSARSALSPFFRVWVSLFLPTQGRSDTQCGGGAIHWPPSQPGLSLPLEFLSRGSLPPPREPSHVLGEEVHIPGVEGGGAFLFAEYKNGWKDRVWESF